MSTRVDSSLDFPKIIAGRVTVDVPASTDYEVGIDDVSTSSQPYRVFYKVQGSDKLLQAPTYFFTPNPPLYDDATSSLTVFAVFLIRGPSGSVEGDNTLYFQITNWGDTDLTVEIEYQLFQSRIV